MSGRHGCWWSRTRSFLLVFLFFQHSGVFNWSLHRFIVKCSWIEGGVYTWPEHCVYVPLWSFPFDLYVFEIGQLIAASVQVLSPTLESTSSLISCVPCWWGVNGTRARWLSNKSCLWDNSNCQEARGISFELIVIFWSRSFTAIVTESGPKSRVHCIPFLETEKIIIYCKLTANWWTLSGWL